MIVSVRRALDVGVEGDVQADMATRTADVWARGRNARIPRNVGMAQDYTLRRAPSGGRPEPLRYNPGAPRAQSGGDVLAVVWQFEVQPGRGDDFEQLHGADGDWTKISRRSRSFLGSSFLKELANPRRYLLVEYWSEMFVYEKHLADFSDQVDELKSRRADMIVETVPFGIFDALDVPERFGPTWSVRDGR